MMQGLVVLLFAIATVCASPIMVVDLQSTPGPSIPVVLAVQVCAGLFNRAGIPAYTLMHDTDAVWLSTLYPSLPSPPPLTTIPAFMTTCFQTVGAKGWIRYNYHTQQIVVPNLLTLAAVLDAIPLEDNSPFLPPSTPLVYDLVSRWANFTAYNATLYMYQNHINETTTMAKMNPGLDVHGDPLHPPLTLSPDLSLGDYIVKARLFNLFLVNGCIPGTEEHTLLKTIALNNPWPRPVAVWGYDDTYPIAGDLFEAETTCVHDMGQIATVGVNNLAFFSQTPAITTPLVQNPVASAVWNASTTYIAFVVGDGDNIEMVKGTRFQWFNERLNACASGAGCFPLAWTISPHLLRVAPAILRWYHNGSLATKHDYFVLPPSGHLYSYPSLFGASDQAAFVASTEADCHLLNSSATVDWEFAGTWGNAIKNFMPRYAAHGVVKGLIATNVPYLFPIEEFAADEFFKVLDDTVVLFRPNEWRGTSGKGLPPFTLNVSKFAARLNAFPPGSVSPIYMTSDGGARLQDFYDLVPHLAPHVQVVDYHALIDVALQSHRARRTAV